jgi:peptidoglycan/LPS O-acetylase OafA/YrhL
VLRVAIDTTQLVDPRDRLLRNLRRKKIPGLDGIRGIAALVVVGMHDQLFNRPDFLGRFYAGRLSVQIFFVISGFLITWLLFQEEERDGSVNRLAFYARRAFRLLPGLLALLVWQNLAKIPPATMGGTVAAALYFANYYSLIFGNDHLASLGQTWSLAVEEHFYFIWPQVFVFFQDRRKLLKGCLIFAAIQFAWRLIAGFGGYPVYAELATETASCAALIGCALALLLWYWPHRLPRWVLYPVLTPISVAALVAIGQLPREAQLIWGVPLSIPFCAIVVLQAATYEWRLLDNPVAHYLGRISYSVYLWGTVAIELTRRLGHDKFHLECFAIAIAVGSASYLLIERPIQSFGRKLIAKSRHTIAPAPAYEVT